MTECHLRVTGLAGAAMDAFAPDPSSMSVVRRPVYVFCWLGW
jgi:hypothetical protein